MRVRTQVLTRKAVTLEGKSSKNKATDTSRVVPIATELPIVDT